MLQVMAKSRAEIQKAYRERQKAKRGNEFLKQEAKRVKTYYVPTAEMSTRKLQKRRERIRKSMKKKRQQDRQTNEVTAEQDHDSENINSTVAQSERMDIDNENGPCDTTTTTATPSTSTGENAPPNRPLPIKMNFARTKKGRKKKSNALKQAEDKIKKLSETLKSARRKNDALRKRLSRTDKHKQESKVSVIDESPKQTIEKRPLSMSVTPKSRTKALMKLSVISPRRHKTISRKLQLHNSMIDDMIHTEHAVKVAGAKSIKRSRSVSPISEVLRLYSG